MVLGRVPPTLVLTGILASLVLAALLGSAVSARRSVLGSPCSMIHGVLGGLCSAAVGARRSVIHGPCLAVRAPQSLGLILGTMLFSCNFLTLSDVGIHFAEVL